MKSSREIQCFAKGEYPKEDEQINADANGLANNDDKCVGSYHIERRTHTKHKGVAGNAKHYLPQRANILAVVQSGTGLAFIGPLRVTMACGKVKQAGRAERISH